MNRLQFLLTLLAEECTEVGQRASKAIRFGLDEVQKGQDLDNKERLHYELNDLIAVILLLNNEFDFNYDLDELDWVAIFDKQEKIEKFYEYSKICGMIHEDTQKPLPKTMNQNICTEIQCEDKEYAALLKYYRDDRDAFKTQYIDLCNSGARGNVSIMNKMHRILEDNWDTVL